MIKQDLIKYNEELMKYHLPLDGVLSFGTMLVLYEATDIDPLYIILIGALIHGIVYPIITIER